MSSAAAIIAAVAALLAALAQLAHAVVELVVDAASGPTERDALEALF
jgi:hypothetical protein